MLQRDGTVVVTRRSRGVTTDEWRGRVRDVAITMLMESLESAGFPDAPGAGGPLLPDEAPAMFTVRRGLWSEQSASVAHRAAQVPGYRNALRIFDAICHLASDGKVGHLAPQLRWLGGTDDGEAAGHDAGEEAAAPAPDHPQVGDDVYLPSERYVSRGEDDFAGGQCQVIAVTLGVSAGKQTAFIEVAEQPGVKHSWEYLAPLQEKLRAELGNRRGRPEPDDRPEFNDSITDQLIEEGEYHQVPVTWRAGGAPDRLETEWGGKSWRLRTGKVPADPRYTLVIDGAEVATYHVLPRAWRLPGA